MPKNEIQPLPKPGNIAPGAELRSSLTEIDRCRAFFDKLELIDYLKSINAFYLENKGKIVGPISSIMAGINEQSENATEGFILDKNSWGGVEIKLEWDKSTDKTGNISLELYYSSTDDYYELWLYGKTSKMNAQESELSVTRLFYRVFRLNPPSIAQDEIDSILLTYTNELLEAKII